MSIDWNVVATIASPIVALFVGVGLNRIIENRPKVVSYLGHVSGIFLSKANPPVQVNTHSVVLRNAGGKTESNVRLGHNVLPDFQIYPDIEHEVKDLPGGQKEIVIPKLIPKKQITITYLYFPPLTWERVNTHLESDSGAIKVLNVLPTVQLPKWILRILWVLIGYGVIGVLYTLYEAYKWLS
ncbi:hypothetical protein SAMN05421690_101379 [Nitrosomonas sp. Nm51]|uniref:hypothetical protein n=1 Tax=Nitrosomonas sp. Nm51 TaxID=133720 RepID=UPI0008ABD3B6|nr:hypothetical protein [Nitrosomonas sp. Nm51]SER23272.1 hypothetical protein SAMN05421690_101379 [Nitrosomonas sp. Nm51]